MQLQNFTKIIFWDKLMIIQFFVILMSIDSIIEYYNFSVFCGKELAIDSFKITGANYQYIFMKLHKNNIFTYVYDLKLWFQWLLCSWPIENSFTSINNVFCTIIKHIVVALLTKLKLSERCFKLYKMNIYEWYTHDTSYILIWIMFE